MSRLLTTLAFLTCALAHQPSAYLDAFQGFLDGFINSDVSGSTSPALAEDCVGRVDVMTTFQGGLLNTEYLYGIFSGVSSLNTTQLIGVPSGASIQSLAIEGPVVSASVILAVYYKTINYTLPLQTDMWMRFDDDLKVESYDMSLRRFPWAFDFLLPKLAPTIAEELGVSYNGTDADNQALTVQRAIADICSTAMEYCTGDNQVYDSNESCMQFLANEVPFGDAWQGGQNTTMCRYIHKNIVKLRPEVHCPQISPSGGDVCIPRSYENVTETFPFASTLVAPNASFTVDNTKGLSEDAVTELMKFSMLQIYPTTFAFYSIPTILYFFLLYVGAKGVEMVLPRIYTTYRDLSFENKRNTVTYAMNTFLTLVALITQGVGGSVASQDYTVLNISLVRVVGNLISGLYIFELTYRPNMRWPLLIHHFCTLFAIIFLQVVLQITEHPAIATAGYIWLFQATTEQSIFIGLFLYRLRYPKPLVKRTLQFAAVQSFLCKMGFATYLVVWWGVKLAKFHTPSDIALSVMLVLICALLMSTQVYGSYAVWSIARNMDRPSKTSDAEKLHSQTSSTTAVSARDSASSS
ncbi:uncharacterized protein EV420DRAFT_312846 [Desarmillaria tabescens]|uniref:TRP C-terminal domain-containing protein n=1 Tax=Armillaria tabescens TaxID=1929756 RepID=A0AA39N6J7_ARMTA|nr:uncharacterized protein EV420DRAFT_312846 [Desarmillaria tabescens]KAK0459273.1 hypothetical protein EV420DRAFT_312846 [Desarmillaria tabescens]